MRTSDDPDATTRDGRVNGPESPEGGQGLSLRAVVPSTLAFTVCFAAWVVNGVLVATLRKEGIVQFDDNQVAWLLAAPILTGAISRVPLGLLTDRFGGRPVLAILMCVSAIPMYLLAYARDFADFLMASLGFGLAGGSFAVGVGYVSACTSRARQGFALGIFGMGNAGAALTTLLSPTLLQSFSGAGPDGWRLLPKGYAALLVITALGFYAITRDRRPASVRSLEGQLAVLRDPVVWRFGLYYFFVFGGFVALAQWAVPYGVSVYELSIAQAGLVASLFSLPSGIVRAAGGWLSDRFGARTVSYWVFGSSAVMCALLAIPKMEIESPGSSVIAKPPGGVVAAVLDDQIRVEGHRYALEARPAELPSETDNGKTWLPSVTVWHEPKVDVGESVVPGQLLARGVSRIFYPANFTLFVVLFMLVGFATGIGKASVYKFIPEHFPNNVGAVGGMVGLIGALGGFVLPPLFGLLLSATGLWSSCWVVLGALSATCLFSMQWVARGIVKDEVPELAQLIERRPSHPLEAPMSSREGVEVHALEDLLRDVPFFASLTRGELSELAAVGDTRRADPGAAVFREGDPGDALYVILKGRVDVYREGESGARVHLVTLDRGRFFGEMALLDGYPRSATVVAKTHCELFLLGRSEFLRRMAITPRMIADVLISLSNSLRQTSSMMVSAVPPAKAEEKSAVKERVW